MAADAPVLAQLAAVASRLGALNPAAPAAPSALPPPQASQAEVAGTVEALVCYLETCADALLVERLDGLTHRLERVAGGAATKAMVGAVAPPLAEMVEMLEGLTARLEAL